MLMILKVAILIFVVMELSNILILYFQAQFQIWEQHEYLQTVVQSPGEGAGTAVCEIHGQLGGKLQVDFSGPFGCGGAVGQ